MRKKVVIGVLAMLLGLVVLEGVCRFVLGLGDPPLYQPHPTIEYLLKPNGNYRRFGNVFKVNRYGMRSSAPAPQKEPGEVRILVLGDSVPNGGALTDQAELATELIRRRLHQAIHRPVSVCNISAGTWSPPNLAAYLDEYGTFDGDVAVIVLNREDLHDIPHFSPLKPYKHPTRKPVTATGELVSRYLFHRLVRLVRRPASPAAAVSDEVCLAALLKVVTRLRADGCAPLLLYHPSRIELGADGAFHPHAVHDRIKAFSVANGVPLLSMAGRYGEAIRAGQMPFRDGFHPNAQGQALIADEIMDALADAGWIKRWSAGS